MPIDAVLFSEMTPAPDWEERFNSWYDTHHIPLRMTSEGFVGAQRYRSTSDNGYLAIYDMTGVDALSTPQYQEIKGNPSEETAWMLKSVSNFTRYIGHLIGWQTREEVSEEDLLNSRYAYGVLFNVPEDRQAEFDDWYDTDHVPLLLKNEHWLGCRRYRIVDGAPDKVTHLAIHHLADLAALESPERAAARQTEWRDRLSQEPWFKGRYVTFERHGERFDGIASSTK
ncbi:hypothetical protein FPY71_13190 [Aureimonas fodinaquatilis]|uniref:EthD domain-containing protein n=1 Tax=Aureimonas fodinaquatilis TaxID=2565783 RepID=A0A5B0DSW6_9HYPH|nr:DUF4286 family protein [Aureimonas fodinaquatilis]KAA0969488.1 hypothetical protein FPY71_13190 [Aureimonas fodinaquatilis]